MDTKTVLDITNTLSGRIIEKFVTEIVQSSRKWHYKVRQIKKYTYFNKSEGDWRIRQVIKEDADDINLMPAGGNHLALSNSLFKRVK